MSTPSGSRLTPSDTREHNSAQPTSRFEALPLEICQRILWFAAGPDPTPVRYDILTAIASGCPQPQLGLQLTEAERRAFKTLMTLSLISRSCRDAMPFVRAQCLKPLMRVHGFEAFLDSDNATVSVIDLHLDGTCTFYDSEERFLEHARRWELAFRRLPRHIRFITFQWQDRYFSISRVMRLTTWAMFRTRSMVRYNFVRPPVEQPTMR